MIPNEDLNNLFHTRELVFSDGSKRPLTSATSPMECHAMYSFLRTSPPRIAVEIGMAYGISTLTILTAMRENGGGKLISIDPYPQFESARRYALDAIQRSGLTAFHEHIQLGSELALPRLLMHGIKSQFVYIDGHHGFDHAFLDMFYADKLVDIGGVIAFDDAHWRSVHKVIKYLLRHRTYEELDVGLPRTYASSNPLFSLLKFLTGRFGSARYFKKSGAWTAPYDFFRNF